MKRQINIKQSNGGRCFPIEKSEHEESKSIEAAWNLLNLHDITIISIKESIDTIEINSMVGTVCKLCLIIKSNTLLMKKKIIGIDQSSALSTFCKMISSLLVLLIVGFFGRLVILKRHSRFRNDKSSF